MPITGETVTIVRVGQHGDGITANQVFVPRTMPGEVVCGEVEHARMPSPRILTPSPDRVRPSCPHYRSCGGCAFQHASDRFVESWKLGMVRQALENRGLPTPIRGMATSPPNTRRRAVLSGRRLKSGAIVGFHASRSDIVTAISGCLLLTPAILQALPGLEALVRIGGSRKGELSLTVTDLDGGLDVSVDGGKALDGPLSNALAALMRRTGLARLTWDGEPVAHFSPTSTRFGSAKVSIPPGAFLQATLAGEQALVEAVGEAIGESRRVVDLFAGCGTFTFPVALRASVHAVEGNAALTESLEQAARETARLKPITSETRDLFRRPLQPDELDHYDAAIVDPPRAGADAQIDQIAKSRVEKVAMVSCHPTTFARDAKVLTDAGFAMDWIEVVDQFRWSTHIELVAQFTRK